MHRCPNRACPSRGLETLINWVQAAADIEGVGEQSIRRLWDEGIVRSLPELYRLTAEQLQQLDGYGEISATKAIEGDRGVEGRFRSFACFSASTSRSLGWVTAQSLARHFGSVDRPAGGDAGRRRGGRRGSAPIARRRSSSGSRTSQIGRLDRGAARARPALRARTGRRPRRGRSRDIRTSSPARSSGGPATRRRRLSRRSARRSRTRSRRRRPGLVVGEEPGNSKLTKAAEVGDADPRRGGARGTSRRVDASRRREHGGESILCLPRPPGRQRIAVLEDGEDVAPLPRTPTAPMPRASSRSSRARAHAADASRIRSFNVPDLPATGSARLSTGPNVGLSQRVREWRPVLSSSFGRAVTTLSRRRSALL